MRKSYTFGVLPTYEEFCEAFRASNVEDGHDPDKAFKVRNCRLVGDVDYTAEELFAECKKFLRRREKPDNTDRCPWQWVSCVLSVLGIEWV
jgi:hypothetical protein